MKVKIIETSEIDNLSIIDPKSGVNWINELMGNHDALPEYDEEQDVFLISKDDFLWWKDLTVELQQADDRLNDLLDELVGNKYYELLDATQEFDGDLEDLPQFLHQICDEWRTNNENDPKNISPR